MLNSIQPIIIMPEDSDESSGMKNDCSIIPHSQPPDGDHRPMDSFGSAVSKDHQIHFIENEVDIIDIVFSVADALFDQPVSGEKL